MQSASFRDTYTVLIEFFKSQFLFLWDIKMKYMEHN